MPRVSNEEACFTLHAALIKSCVLDSQEGVILLSEGKKAQTSSPEEIKCSNPFNYITLRKSSTLKFMYD